MRSKHKGRLHTSPSYDSYSPGPRHSRNRLKKRQEKQVSSARKEIASSLTTPGRKSPQTSSSSDSGSSSGKDKDRLRLMSLEMSSRMRRLDSPALYRRRTLAMTQVTQLPD